MKSSLIRFVLATGLSLGLWPATGSVQAQGARAKQPAAILSPTPRLNPDGTLDLTRPAFGALDLSGYTVSLDAQRGPIFSAEADATSASSPGQWLGIGTGAGPLKGQVLALAVMGTDVFIGGSFNDAANLPAADYLVRWNGVTWSALGAAANGDGALTSVVYALAVHGTDLYVGGSFSRVSDGSTSINAAARIARWDGTHWFALGSNGANGPALNSTVQAIAVDAAGVVYVGGWFNNVNNNGVVVPEADYLARWDGANWSALGSNGVGDGALNAVVYALHINGGDLYAGGSFTDVNDGGVPLTAADYVALWDGTAWLALGSNGAANGAISGTIRALARFGAQLIVGGSFVNVSNHGATLGAADFIAQWDGTNWSALGNNGSGNGSLGYPVNSLTVSGASLYIGGCFVDVANGGSTLTAADGVARWDGVNWSALGSNGSGNGAIATSGNCQVGVVSALAGLSDGQVLVGGNFYDLNDGGTVLPQTDMLARWEGAGWSALGDIPNGALNSTVQAMVVDGTDLYIGGGFTDLSNHGVNLGAGDYVAKWDGVNWTALGSNGAGNGALNGGVVALALDSQGRLYAGGYFTNVNDGGVALPTADYVARWDGAHWEALGDNGAGNGALNGLVMSLEVTDSDVYVGGFFTNAGNNDAADYIARWDGATWSALGSDGAGGGSLNNWVQTMASDGDRLYVGGWFTDVNSGGAILGAADFIAYWEGGAWSALGGDGAGGGALSADPSSYGVRDILIDRSELYVAGDFVNVNNNGVVLTAADYIARWDGASWSALGSNGAGNGALFGGDARSVVLSGSVLYVGGTFRAVNNSFAGGYAARWDGTNWSSLSSNGAGGSPLNTWVHVLALLGDDLIVGGSFNDVVQNGAAIPEADYLATFGIGIDTTAPQITSITRLMSNPTARDRVSFAVTFSENVTGVAAADFVLQTTGLSDVLINTVTGTNSNYVVDVATGTGDGTLQLTVPVTASIADLTGNPLDGLPFTTGEAYTVFDQFQIFLPGLAR